MDQSSLFHWSFVLVFLATFAISGFYRRRARQSGEAIRRSQESRMVILLRVFFALPFYLAALTYMVNPAWMDWSAMSMPLWLRLLATVVALALIPVIYWTMRSIGNNVSETYLTKTNHVLVTHGPYRWVRHPIYTVATTLFVALSMVAANWFMLVMAVMQTTMLALVVIPREEAQLTLKFGAGYQAYQQRTGQLLPRWGGHS